MWRICRKTIFPRWHTSRQNPVEGNNKGNEAVVVKGTLSSSSENDYSQGNHRKQHADKKFWDDPQFHYYSFRSSLLETAGFLGAGLALCMNHHRHKILHQHESPRSSCMFSRLAFAMPQKLGLAHTRKLKIITSSTTQNSSEESKSNNVSESTDDKAQQLAHVITQFAANVENSAGIQKLKTNTAKAFHCFREAAHLGSSQGFYNLGLCYELGNGTDVNLNKAAECYRQAALKGHGLASFNLAIYFVNGWGGLPVDQEAAGLLFKAAASENVTEAQLYLGIEYLEKQMWSDAFTIFSKLSKKNNLDGKYYLGQCYENGWGVKKNMRVAAEMFSQAASQGHLKSTLCLGKYYEQGLGGCNQDVGFALALYRLAADKGNEDGKKAYTALKTKQLTSSKLSTSNTQLTPKPERSNLHTSASVPELNSENFRKNANPDPLTPPYLNLMLPTFPYKPIGTCKVAKTKFYLGGDEILGLVPPLSKNVQLMTAGT